MNHGKIPAVYMIDAEIVCVDHGQDRIALVLSGKKRGLNGEGRNRPAIEEMGGALNLSVKDKIERVESIERRKRDIEDAIENLQQIYLTLSE